MHGQLKSPQDIQVNCAIIVRTRPEYTEMQTQFSTVWNTKVGWLVVTYGEMLPVAAHKGWLATARQLTTYRGAHACRPSCAHKSRGKRQQFVILAHSYA